MQKPDIWQGLSFSPRHLPSRAVFPFAWVLLGLRTRSVRNRTFSRESDARDQYSSPKLAL